MEQKPKAQEAEEQFHRAQPDLLKAKEQQQAPDPALHEHTHVEDCVQADAERQRVDQEPVDLVVDDKAGLVAQHAHRNVVVTCQRRSRWRMLARGPGVPHAAGSGWGGARPAPL